MCKNDFKHQHVNGLNLKIASARKQSALQHGLYISALILQHPNTASLNKRLLTLPGWSLPELCTGPYREIHNAIRKEWGRQHQPMVHFFPTVNSHFNPVLTSVYLLPRSATWKKQSFEELYIYIYIYIYKLALIPCGIRAGIPGNLSRGPRG